MDIIDNNNNLTLFILLIGLIILVICYKKRETQESFQDNSPLISLIKKENELIENINTKLALLKKSKIQNSSIKLQEVNAPDPTLKYSSFDTNKLAKYTNTLENDFNRYDKRNFINNTKDDIQDRIICEQTKKLKELQDLKNQNNRNTFLNSANNQIEDDNIFENKVIKSIKNPYYNVNYKVKNNNKNQFNIVACKNTDECFDFDNNMSLIKNKCSRLQPNFKINKKDNKNEVVPIDSKVDIESSSYKCLKVDRDSVSNGRNFLGIYIGDCNQNDDENSDFEKEKSMWNPQH